MFEFLRFVNSLKSSSFGTRFLSCVPKHNLACDNDVNKLVEFFSSHSNILAVTGAGISTESGIPDYRSEVVGLYARSSTRPVLFRDFVKSKDVQKRYWARNFAGWPKFSLSQPNITHYCLKQLQDLQKVHAIVTQNVDSLHSKASSRNVIELHGTAYRVVCFNCDYEIDRESFQKQLEIMNPDFTEVSVIINPDGDVEVTQEAINKFQFPECPKCSGILKPDIVFFGDNVPKQKVQLVKDEVTSSDSVIVLGSSLTVFSSYRIVLQASELKKTIVILNIGQTRGDPLSNLKLNFRCGDVLPRVVSLIKQSH